MPPTTSNVEYGAGWGESPYDELELPSGAKCLVRKLQMEDMIEMGIVDDLDYLGSIVNDEHVERVKRPADHAKKKLTKAQQKAEAEKADRESTKRLVQDKEGFKKMAGMVDDIVVKCLVKPTVVSGFTKNDDGTRSPLPMDQRTTGAIYTDTIGFEDKMEIFSAVFSGVQKMSDFRKGSTEDLADVEAESVDEVSPE